MIVCILISIPIFNSDTWFDNVTTYTKSVSYFNAFTENITEFETQIPIFISQMVNYPRPLVFFSVNFSTQSFNFPNDYPDFINITTALNNIRDYNVDVYNSGENSPSDITIAFDKSPLAVFQAQLNIGRTLFVCVIMIVVTLLFTRDV